MTELTPAHVDLLGRIADVLLTSTRGAPVPTELGGFAGWTLRAARARSRTMDPVVAALAAIDAGDVEGSLRRLESSASAGFELIASIAVGAYTMHPDVMAAVGYPEPRRAPVPFDQSAEELASGVLDPVLGIGRPLLRPAPD
jgi:hypothetical protein